MPKVSKSFKALFIAGKLKFLLFRDFTGEKWCKYVQAIWLDPLIIKIPRRDASGNEEIKQNKEQCVQSEDCGDENFQKCVFWTVFHGFFFAWIWEITLFLVEINKQSFYSGTFEEFLAGKCQRIQTDKLQVDISGVKSYGFRQILYQLIDLPWVDEDFQNNYAEQNFEKFRNGIPLQSRERTDTKWKESNIAHLTISILTLFIIYCTNLYAFLL